MAAALGTHVELFYALDPKGPAPRLSGELASGSASARAEVLKNKAADAQVTLRYDKDLDGSSG